MADPTLACGSSNVVYPSLRDYMSVAKSCKCPHIKSPPTLDFSTSSSNSALTLMIPINLILFAAISWGGNVTAECFLPSPPGRTPIHPTIFKDCLDGIKELVKYDKAYAPTLFRRTPGLGFKLPHHWTSRSCAIFLDLHSDEDEDLVSFYDIAVEAGVLNGACVAPPPHLGGTIAVGARGILNVSLFGRARREGLQEPVNLTTLPHDTA